VLYVANVAEDGFENNPLLDSVRAHAAAEKAEVVAVCAAIESEIADLDDEEKQMFLADLGLDEPGLDRLIRAGYKLLGLPPTSPPASRKYAPGPSTRATPHRRQPASFTPISNVASFAPRPSPSTISLLTTAKPGPRKPARCAPRARNTS
jgi:hypothetical protein